MDRFDFFNHYVIPLWKTSSEPYLVLDSKGTVIDCNPSALACLPIAPGSSLVERIDDQSLIQDHISQCLEQNDLKDTPTLVIKNEQQSIHCSLRMYPIRIGPSQPCSYILAKISQPNLSLHSIEQVARLNDQRIQSLHEQLTHLSKELIEKTYQLAEQKNKISAIIDGMSEGLIACDIQGRIVHINHAACEMLRLPVENTTGASFSQTCRELANAIGYDLSTIATLKRKIVDAPFEKKEFRLSVSPVYQDKTDQVIGIVIIMQDRTEQAELDRMKSDLISIVSHELRSPLTSIKGYIDLMIAGDLGPIPDDMAGYLSIISSNANRLAALIDDMLDLSRIESGQLSMSFGKVDVKYLCDYVYLTMKPQAEQKNLEYILDANRHCLVSGDVDRLQQALTNLVSNAIKYTPSGGRVSIELAERPDTVCITVRDTGIGINIEDQKRLFQRFFRVKNAKTRNIGGTGLGLCITKSIVEAHRGQLALESEEDRGSTFTIHLPAFQG